MGVYLYFVFLKWFAWGFTITALLTIPALISNSISGGLGVQSKSSLDLISAGNQKTLPTFTNDPTAVNFLDSVRVYRGLLLGSDVTYTFVFIIMIVTFKIYSWVQISRYYKEIACLADYTAYVEGFPSEGISENKIRKQFARTCCNCTIEDVVDVNFTYRFKKLYSVYEKQDKLNKKLWKWEI